MYSISNCILFYLIRFQIISFLKAYCEAGGNDQAVQCLDQMVSEGLHPNVITYAAAMAACKHK